MFYHLSVAKQQILRYQIRCLCIDQGWEEAHTFKNNDSDGDKQRWRR